MTFMTHGGNDLMITGGFRPPRLAPSFRYSHVRSARSLLRYSRHMRLAQRQRYSFYDGWLILMAAGFYELRVVKVAPEAGGRMGALALSKTPLFSGHFGGVIATRASSPLPISSLTPIAQTALTGWGVGFRSFRNGGFE